MIIMCSPSSPVLTLLTVKSTRSPTGYKCFDKILLGTFLKNNKI